MNRPYVLSVLVLTGALFAPACGGESPPARAAEAPSDEILRYQAVLRDLSSRPDVSGSRLELEKCEAWLASSRARAGSDPDSPDIRLYLDAVNATLVKVKSDIALREAETTVKAKDDASANAGSNSGTKEVSR